MSPYCSRQYSAICSQRRWCGCIQRIGKVKKRYILARHVPLSKSSPILLEKDLYHPSSEERTWRRSLAWGKLARSSGVRQQVGLPNVAAYPCISFCKVFMSSRVADVRGDFSS